MNIKYKQDRFLEELSARMVLAGARRFEPVELRDMKLGDLMNSIYCNSIELKSVSVKPFDYNDDYK